MTNKHRPRDPDAVYVPIDTGSGVILYGLIETRYDHPPCNGEINPFTGKPWDTERAVIRPTENVDPYGESNG